MTKISFWAWQIQFDKILVEKYSFGSPDSWTETVGIEPAQHSLAGVGAELGEKKVVNLYHTIEIQI